MIRYATVFVLCLQASNFYMVDSLKQQIQLSDSYLPVAMQVIAHLTDQMAYEVKDDPSPSKPTTKKPIKPLGDSLSGSKPIKPSTGNKPGARPTTPKPVYVSDGYFGFNPQGGWFMNLQTRLQQTTPFHKPGYYAPVAPPKPSDRTGTKGGYVLLPIHQDFQYTVIEPAETRTEEPLLSIHHEEVKPLVEPVPESPPLLPPSFQNFEDKDVATSRSEDDLLDEENLQYLSENVREMIRMANDVDDERVVDVWDGLKGGLEQGPKGQMSSSNLRLLLLYDLLSREAKRQRLNDYSGYSPDVMMSLVESSGGGARAQLSLALSKMVARKDCGHEYANNRAKEMVDELAKDESKLSSELRYLQPLVYKN